MEDFTHNTLSVAAQHYPAGSGIEQDGGLGKICPNIQLRQDAPWGRGQRIDRDAR
jgi:hypothetical protein